MVEASGVRPICDTRHAGTICSGAGIGFGEGFRREWYDTTV